MAVTTATSTEAAQQLVDRINSGDAYDLDVKADRTDLLIDPMEEVKELRVDVVCDEESQLVETLTVEDRSSHIVRVWIRDKPRTKEPKYIDPLKLLVRQIFQRLDNWDSADGRVRVWECDIDGKQVPDKRVLKETGLFVAALVLRVEVEAS